MILFFKEVSVFFGHHKLNNISVRKGNFRSTEAYNICKGKLLFAIICCCLQIKFVVVGY